MFIVILMWDIQINCNHFLFHIEDELKREGTWKIISHPSEGEMNFNYTEYAFLGSPRAKFCPLGRVHYPSKLVSTLGSLEATEKL